jgi:hypothetical protein
LLAVIFQQTPAIILVPRRADIRKGCVFGNASAALTPKRLLQQYLPQAEVVSASKVSPVSAVPTTGKVAFSSFAPESTA